MNLIATVRRIIVEGGEVSEASLRPMTAEALIAADFAVRRRRPGGVTGPYTVIVLTDRAIQAAKETT